MAPWRQQGEVFKKCCHERITIKEEFGYNVPVNYVANPSLAVWYSHMRKVEQNTDSKAGK